jgi:hypothetical protein
VFVFKPRPQEARERTNIMLYEPAPHPVMYVVPAADVLGKVPVVPAGENGTIPTRSAAGLGSGRFADVGRADTPGSPGSGSRLYYVNRWGIDWATDERMPASQIDEDDTSNDDSDGEEGMEGMEDNM